MRLLLIMAVFVYSTVFAQERETTIDYSLSFDGNKIHVEMLLKPIDKDCSKFMYGNVQFGGQTDILKGLQNVSVESPSRFSIDSGNRTVIFYHPQQMAVKINYDIVDTRTADNTRNQLFRPMIMKNYFFTHGLNIFLTPAFNNPDTTVLISVQWKQPPPFPVFYAFDPDNDGKHKVITTADSIAFRPFTGATDLSIKKFSSESGDNYLVIRSAQMPDSVRTTLEKFYLHYNTIMRQFWNDKRIIKYSLVLEPFLNVNHPMSGVSFGNGFIGKYNKADSLVKGYRRMVIAHEIGHYYLGSLKAYAGDKNEGQWFDEGFNDYLTFFNLVKSGSMQADEFETEFNRVMKSLYSSTIKNTPNNKIFENFWLLGDYAKLPYWRGCIFALYMDNQISLASKNKHTLRDVLLELKQLVDNRKQKEFGNEEFIKAVSKYIPYNIIEKSFTDYITNGEPIALDEQNWLPCFNISTKDQLPVLTITDKKQFYSHFQFAN